MKRVVLLLFFMVILAVVAGCSKPSTVTSTAPTTPVAPAKEGYSIGVCLPLTGDTAIFGESSRNGAELAFKEINAAGGIDGRRIKVSIADTTSKANTVPGLVQKLINVDNAQVIIGESTSSATLQGAPLCQKAQVPMVTPSATNPEITQKGDYIFRICYTDDFQGRVCAQFASQNLKLTRAAILKDVRSAYSIGLANVFKTDFEKAGGKIVAEESYSANDLDFGAQLIKIEAANPQVLFIPGYYNDVGSIARAVRLNHKLAKCILLGGDGWDSPKLVENAGAAIEGSYFCNHYSVEENRPVVQKFVADYKTQYGATPDAFAALGYDTAAVILDAIKRAQQQTGGKEPTRQAIRDALAATKDFPGVTGKITIDKNRNCVKPAVILQVKDGKWQYVTSIAP
jgi:branched-chain amino acid transport system substrate-binding protein